MNSSPGSVTSHLPFSLDLQKDKSTAVGYISRDRNYGNLRTPPPFGLAKKKTGKKQRGHCEWHIGREKKRNGVKWKRPEDFERILPLLTYPLLTNVKNCWRFPESLFC